MITHQPLLLVSGHALTLITLDACMHVTGGVTTIIIPMPLRFMLSKTVELGVYAGFMMV